jgi:hypothetical protein
MSTRRSLPRRPLALAAAAALSLGVVACDGAEDITSDHEDPAADPEDDPGLEETDEGTTDDPAGEDVADS